MLTLLFRDEYTGSDKEVLSDIEFAFKKVKLTGNVVERQILQLVEHASYHDKDSFIDRFGYKLHLSELSTGCKAALVVAHFPNQIVDLIECGFNARDVIISVCKDGFVLLDDDGVTYEQYSDSIDVRVDEYEFSTVERLNRYIKEERPFGIQYGWEGVKRVQQS